MAGHHKFRVEREPAATALRQIAEPLIGVTLAGRAPLVDDGDHAMAARPQPPAGERTAAEEVVEGADDAAVVRERKLGAEGENPVNHLPGAMDAGVEPPAVAGADDRGPDPVAQRRGGRRPARLGGGRRRSAARRAGPGNHDPDDRGPGDSGPTAACTTLEHVAPPGCDTLEYSEPVAPGDVPPMPLFFDPAYMLAVAPAILLALWAQWRVKSAFAAASREPAPLTGAAAARHILDSAGATDVEIEPIPGTLNDHYDPQKKVLRLSEGVYGSRSLAAVGIAAHEAGHALQDAQSFSLMTIRNAAVNFANVGSGLGLYMFMFGLMLASRPLAWLGIALFAGTVLFQVVNLPVEIDASNRAKAQLVSLGIVPAAEMPAVNTVLNAAAWTYVAATLQSILALLYYASYLTGGDGDSDRS